MAVSGMSVNCTHGHGENMRVILAVLLDFDRLYSLVFGLWSLVFVLVLNIDDT